VTGLLLAAGRTGGGFRGGNADKRVIIHKLLFFGRSFFLEDAEGVE
jgi:hypothetical protein